MLYSKRVGKSFSALLYLSIHPIQQVTCTKRGYEHHPSKLAAPANIHNTHIFKIRRRQLVSFSHCTSSNVRVESVTRLTTVSQRGQGNVFRRESSRSTQEVQLLWGANMTHEVCEIGDGHRNFYPSIEP